MAVGAQPGQRLEWLAVDAGAEVERDEHANGRAGLPARPRRATAWNGRACSTSSAPPRTRRSSWCVGGAGAARARSWRSGCADDPRSVAWVTVTAQHDDPAVLLGDIVHALDEFEPLEPRAKQQLAVGRPSTSRPCSSLASSARWPSAARPFVLVLDDAHRLRRRQVWALVQALADCVPTGSQLVVVSRQEPELALGRMRADRRVHELGAEAPRHGPERGRASCSEAPGSRCRRRRSRPLWSRTEGWPVGLYLATLVLADADDPVAAAAEFAGDDRIVVDYVREELLGVLPRRTRDFLLHASVLDELRAPVCDAVLERTTPPRSSPRRPCRSTS